MTIRQVRAEGPTWLRAKGQELRCVPRVFPQGRFGVGADRRQPETPGRDRRNSMEAI